MKILFVCLGNICRSPLAEELFRVNFTNQGYEGFFETDSCGTGGWHQGELADIRTRNTAKKHGINLLHKARQIENEDIHRFDLLLVMDQKNLRDVRNLFPFENEKIKLISEYSVEYAMQEVPDPYYGDQNDFDFVHNMLNQITKEIVSEFKPK